MIPLIYSSEYDITAFGLERLHPFHSRKYRRIRDWLIVQGLRKADEFIAPQPFTEADLLRVHTPDYLLTLRDRRILARILEVPLLRYLPACLTDWRVLRPMRWASGGTLLACRFALENGLAINLGGGYHHACHNRGGGFCIYADVPLALLALKEKGRIASALVVDTEAHQGDGTADAIRAWPWAHLLDLLEADLFPWPKVEEDIAVSLPPRTHGAEYLDALREHLPVAVVLYERRADTLGLPGDRIEIIA